MRIDDEHQENIDQSRSLIDKLDAVINATEVVDLPTGPSGAFVEGTQAFITVEQLHHDGHPYSIAVISTAAGIAVGAVVAYGTMGPKGLAATALMAAERIGMGEGAKAFIISNGLVSEALIL